MCIRDRILIEDIDAFFNAREKQDTRIQISFSGLLNAIDGVGAQEGRIVVLTTNPVSYTHLDVYKRQARTLTNLVQNTRRQSLKLAVEGWRAVFFPGVEEVADIVVGVRRRAVPRFAGRHRRTIQGVNAPFQTRDNHGQR